jgi:hypothetical protein
VEPAARGSLQALRGARSWHLKALGSLLLPDAYQGVALL